MVVAICKVSKYFFGFLGGVGYIGSVCFHSCKKVPNALELSVGFCLLGCLVFVLGQVCWT